MLIDTIDVLHAYIRTGTRPFQGKDWFDDDNDPKHCCPVGVLCLAKGVHPRGMDSTMLYEFYDIEVAYVDGFVAGWEESPLRPTEHGYERCECQSGQRCTCGEALNLFDNGYSNGERVRMEMKALNLL